MLLRVPPSGGDPKPGASCSLGTHSPLQSRSGAVLPKLCFENRDILSTMIVKEWNDKTNLKITPAKPHWSRLVSVLFRTYRPLFTRYFKQIIHHYTLLHRFSVDSKRPAPFLFNMIPPKFNNLILPYKLRRHNGTT